MAQNQIELITSNYEPPEIAPSLEPVEVPNFTPLLLADETYQDVDATDLLRRKHILGQLKTIPNEMFGSVQMLQPETGCFNRCGFCSQHAGTDVWSITTSGLRNFVAAMRAELTERFPDRAEEGEPLLGFDRSHKPGVIFPYLDNDVGSNDRIDMYVELIGENLHVKSRFSTVGFSALNDSIVASHERVATELTDYVDGVRFSFTPYTFGWTGASGSSREQYIEDFSNSLATYRPLVEKKGPGKDSAAVELRFKPNIPNDPAEHDTSLVETVIDGRAIVAGHGYLVISDRDELPETARIDSIDGRTALYDKDPDGVTVIEGTFSGDADERHQQYSHFVKMIDDGNFDLGRGSADVEVVSREEPEMSDQRQVEYQARRGQLYKFENEDGYYYGIDPERYNDGSYHAIQLYPENENRSSAAVLDSRRFFLNTLIEHKKARGLGFTDSFDDATETDALQVTNRLFILATEMGEYAPQQAKYIREEVIPMVQAYIQALLAAGYHPKYLFDPKFTRDTGVIVNQGRAYADFRAITAFPDTPITPDEVKSDFANSDRGHSVRIAPNPFEASTEEGVRIASIGRKNQVSTPGSVSFSYLSVIGFTPISATVEVSGVETERRRLSDARENLLFPGAKND